MGCPMIYVTTTYVRHHVICPIFFERVLGVHLKRPTLYCISLTEINNVSTYRYIM
jgi:hypothetical protein